MARGFTAIASTSASESIFVYREQTKKNFPELITLFEAGKIWEAFEKAQFEYEIVEDENRRAEEQDE
ncbi:hypothetical protein Q9L58_007946 [Maublancomyces gigas]|uniref:Uncharacterized protein n=1 Tax=Discina gigas TaxID=1032678 RepID=A0ABR3GBL5_9PEZI